MNMDLIYMIFAVIFGVLVIAMIILGSMHISLARKRGKYRRSLPAPPAPMEINSEDLTIRIKDAQVDAYDTPQEEPEPEVQAEEVDGVLLPRIEKLSFREKYERLEPEKQRLLDLFSDYAASKEECEKILQSNALCFRFRKGQVAKAVIRRESVYLNFSILNPDLGRMVREEKVGGLKMKPVEIRLETEDDLGVAKQTADLTIEYLMQEEEYKLEKRKEARREAARLRREEAAVAKD